jgi:hypothetical protein
LTVNTWAMKELVGNLRVQADPFGIYKQRRMMTGVRVYRGDEWWTAAADKVIQDEMDAKHVKTVSRDLMEVLD